MFWNSVTSRIDELLDSLNPTLDELMSEDDFLDKIREQNQRLIDFLNKEESVNRLIDLVLFSDDGEHFDELLYRFPNLACEVLSERCHLISPDIQSNYLPAALDDCFLDLKVYAAQLAGSGVIAASETSPPAPPVTTPTETLVAIPNHLPFVDRLLAPFLIPDSSTINSLSASHLCKVLCKWARSDTAVSYLRQIPGLLDGILSKIGFSAVVNLLVSFVERAVGCQWLLEECVVDKLLDRLGPANLWNIQQSSASCLIRLLNAMRFNLAVNSPCMEQNEDPGNAHYEHNVRPQRELYQATDKLLEYLCSEKSTSTLLGHILHPDRSSTLSVVSSIHVLMVLLNKRKYISETNFCVNDDHDWIIDSTVSPSFTSVGASMFTDESHPSTLTPTQTVHRKKPSNFWGKSYVTQTAINLAKVCLPKLDLLRCHLSECPPSLSHIEMTTTAGVLKPPLGIVRLNLAQFVASLSTFPIHTGLPEALLTADFTQPLMTLFESYPLNSLLHQSVKEYFQAFFIHARLIENTYKHAEEANNATLPNNVSCNDNASPCGNGDGRLTASSIAEEQAPVHETPESEGSTHSPSSFDRSFRAVFQNTCLTDWFIDLLSRYPSSHFPFSLLSSERPCPNSSPNTEDPDQSRSHPKLGYSGHVRQLAGLLYHSLSGAEKKRTDFATELINSLGPSSMESWNKFVKEDLEVVNKLQVPDVVTDRSELNSFPLSSLNKEWQRNLGVGTKKGGSQSDTSDADLFTRITNWCEEISALPPDEYPPVIADSANKSLFINNLPFGNNINIRVGPRDFDLNGGSSCDSDEDINDSEDRPHFSGRLPFGQSEQSDDDDDDDEDLNSPAVIKQQRSDHQTPQFTPELHLSVSKPGSNIENAPFSESAHISPFDPWHSSTTESPSNNPPGEWNPFAETSTNSIAAPMEAPSSNTDLVVHPDSANQTELGDGAEDWSAFESRKPEDPPLTSDAKDACENGDKCEPTTIADPAVAVNGIIDSPGHKSVDNVTSIQSVLAESTETSTAHEQSINDNLNSVKELDSAVVDSSDL